MRTRLRTGLLRCVSLLAASALAGCLGIGGDAGLPSFDAIRSSPAAAGSKGTVFFTSRVDRGRVEVLGLHAEYLIHIAGTCPFAGGELDPKQRRAQFEPFTASSDASGGAYDIFLTDEDSEELNARGPLRWITYRLGIEYRSAASADTGYVWSPFFRTSPEIAAEGRREREVRVDCP